MSEFKTPFVMKNKQDKQLNFDLSETLFTTSHIFNSSFTLHFLLLIFNFSSQTFNPIALRKPKIVYNFGLSECNRVNCGILLPTMTLGQTSRQV